jgi:(S)-mandelate dehydrogenase
MLLNVDDYRAEARRLLPRFVFDCVDGAAEDERCLSRNEQDLAAMTLAPRVLRDTVCVDTSVEVLGTRWRVPFGIAPTGLNGLVRPNGDLILAESAHKAGTCFALSTASNMTLEDIRHRAPDGPLWMQLYVMQRDMAEQIVKRARNVGYDALVLTVDVPVSGIRERDRRNGLRMPFQLTPRLAWDLFTHPRWSVRAAFAGQPQFVNILPDTQSGGSAPMQAALLARSMDRSVVWESLSWLRDLWKGPLLLKGVLHHDDARLAIAHGVDGLIVSNHGGRQLDCAPSAIAALPAVVSAAEGRIPVFMDGGIRRGSDIAKAIVSGATAIFVGRPTLFGLASRGGAGVDGVLRALSDELTCTMSLLGTSSIAGLRRMQLQSVCRSVRSGLPLEHRNG